MALKYYLVDKPNDRVVVDFGGKRALVPFDEMLAMWAGHILDDSDYEPFVVGGAADGHDRADGWMLGCDFDRRYGVRVIDEGDVKRGMLMGWVYLCDDGCGTTACRIGDSWFYFGGETAEEEGPWDYACHMDFDETVRSIVEVLDELRETEPTEWLCYRYLLSND